MISISKDTRTHTQDLLDYIDASPSPWHAALETSQRLSKAGFIALHEAHSWQLQEGGKYYVTRGDASIIAFIIGARDLLQTGIRMVGAHTDSPGLRLKPHPAFASDGLIRIGVEVYGGPILATFTDRDLSIAGRVTLRTKDSFRTTLVKFDKAVMRLPNLAIHMNREVNDKGLVLNKQTELPLIFAENETGIAAEQQFLHHLANSLNTKIENILTFEFNVFDTQKGSFWGANQEFIANSQLDNLASCHAAIEALIASKNPMVTRLCALFDHEEVGSDSATGANGNFLADVVSRIVTHQTSESDAQQRILAKSFFISADMAHAFHPNYAGAYEPYHHIHVNQGPVIKTNANQRYTTNAETAAQFIRLCEEAHVPYQQYSHRTDLGCGSTIGPLIASNLGVASVDVGCPIWAMHSIRESAGVQDHAYMTQVLKQHFDTASA